MGILDCGKDWNIIWINHCFFSSETNNSYYCLTEALTESVHTEAVWFSQSMLGPSFSVKILSHFPSSYYFGVKLMVLNQVSQSHGKLQNHNDKFIWFSSLVLDEACFNVLENKNNPNWSLVKSVTDANREVQCLTCCSWIAPYWVLFSQSNL